MPNDAGGLTGLDYVVLVVYAAAMLGMGSYIAIKQRSTEDFFVGGRNLPAWAVGLSLLASLMSTITYLGMPGEMFRTGMGFLTRYLAIPFVLLVVWFLWVPFFMRLKLTSAYEYVERRFNYATRVLAAVFCMAILLGLMAVVVLTASNAMAEIVALDLPWFFGVNSPEFRDADLHAIILAIGLFSVVYTTLGGIRAVVWTDVVQFFILVGGAAFTIVYVAVKTDSGLGDWVAAQRAYPHGEEVEWFSWDVTNRTTVFFVSISAFFWLICTHGANQMALQRYFTVSNPWAARRSYLVSALANLGLGLLLAAVGLALLYFIREHSLPAAADVLVEDRAIRYPAQDRIFPQFIRFYLPSGLRGLVVAALFAAAMSTIDSGANSMSTIITVDFVRRLRSGQATAEAELRLARMLTATMGLVIVVVSIILYHAAKETDIIALCQKGFNCFLGPLGALFVLGLFSSRATPATVIPAFLLGETFGVCSSYSSELFGFPFSTHLVIAGSWLTTIISGHAIALVLGSRASEEQRSWMWWPVVTKQDG